MDGKGQVVVLGHALWQRRFGADPNMIGRTVLLNAQPYTVVGVAPSGFNGTVKMITGEFWVTTSVFRQVMPDFDKEDLRGKRDAQWIMVAARLKPGVTTAQAITAVNVVKNRIDETYYKGDQERRKKTVRLTQAGGMPEMGNTVGLMVVLMVVVGLVLLIACANVANLMLARAASRHKEIGIRLAIGAGRMRLVRQLLTESIALAMMGAAVGFALAWIAAGALSKVQLPMSFPIAFDFSPDGRVLAFTVGLSILTGIIFGLAPAIRSARTDLVSCIKDQGAAIGTMRRFGLRNALVVLQVCLSLVLLVGAGLFVRSLQNASRIDLGMKTDNVVMMAFDPKLNAYAPERTRQLLTQLRDRVSALPGIQSVSYVDSVPLSIGGVTFDFETTDHNGKRTSNADVYRVGRRFFETIGTPMVRGRDFDLRDADGTAIVNEKLASTLFPKSDPIGQTIRAEKAMYQIIAVVKNAKSRTLGEETAACAYLSLEGDPAKVMSFFGISIVARTGPNAARYARAIQDQIQFLDSNLPVTSTETMQEHIDKALLLPKACATLLGTFGLVGLALATVGLYGVLSYVVRSRTREIGIRMALGANHTGVLGMITRQGVALALVGIAAGMAIAWSLARFAGSFLYGIDAHDTVTFVGVPLVLLVVAMVAVLVPARRASRVEPMSALRYE